ncbi:MAG: hypothetical protein FJX52_02380 [Alphaproteobacteria bacterium]|nr:hypothetical protein [Alphaproteobacteria bacterium]
MSVNKAAYVRSQKQDRPHACHWPGCQQQVPPAMWGCRRHWFLLPKPIRDGIWRTYRQRQERDLRPSPEYLAAVTEAQRWIATQAGPAAK